MSASPKTCFLFALMVAIGSSAFGQGIMLTGAGAVNRSMGGASVAAPIDAMGALHWNPASISGLQCNEMSFSAEVLYVDQELTVGGVTADDESGALPIPSMGWVHHIDGTPNTIGLGLYSVGGFAQNLPSVVGHPILDPAGPFSPLYSEAQFFQIVPTLSRSVSDRLSIGFSPTINMGRVEVDPLLFGPAALGPGAGTRWSWGIGAQLGVYYLHSDTTHFGFSIKSPQWFEDFRTLTKVGGPPATTPTVSRFKLDLPMIVSAGMSYTGVPDWMFALDLRYFDYKNTDGFGSTLGWDNVFSVALGAQRKVNDKLYVRGGYTFNTSPIDTATIGLNFASPLIQQHVVGLGASYSIAENVDLTLAYNQILVADRSGPSLFGPQQSSQIASYSIAAAVTVRYGS